IIEIFASERRGVFRSTIRSFTLAATAASSSRLPIAAATCCGVVPLSYCFLVPSGRVTKIALMNEYCGKGASCGRGGEYFLPTEDSHLLLKGYFSAAKSSV